MSPFRLNLNVKVTLSIGVILLLGMTLTYLGLRAHVEQLRTEGIRQAKMINRLVFEALYTSMRAGSGREGNHEVAEGLQRMEQIRQIRLIHGPPIDRQYGVEEEETPADEAERRALRGKVVVEMVRVEVRSGDEVGQLSRSINQMADNLKRAWEEIDQKNLQLDRRAETLEQKVAERTTALLESQEELCRSRDFVLRVAQDLEERGIQLREETEELKERLIESQKLATLGQIGA